MEICQTPEDPEPGGLLESPGGSHSGEYENPRDHLEDRFDFRSELYVSTVVHVLGRT